MIKFIDLGSQKTEKTLFAARFLDISFLANVLRVVRQVGLLKANIYSCLEGSLNYSLLFGNSNKIFNAEKR